VSDDRRTQRRIGVGLTVLVRGTDSAGKKFEETTASYDVSRTGASFALHHALEVGHELEITILKQTPAESDRDFVTQGRVVRILPGEDEDEKLIGVRFIGPRFHRVFVPESGA
jgi:c-di-GMP-binding flagellar brake protein YcgR